MKTWKKCSVGAVIVLLLGIFSCEDPNAAGNEFTVTVSGQVFNYNGGAAQDSVVVTLDNPFRRDTTKSDGTFSYTFTSSEKNEIEATLTFRHVANPPVFYDTTRTIKYSSTQKTITLPDVRMRAVNPANDSVVTGLPSSTAGIIMFKGASDQSLSIRGAGASDATYLTFEVRDSLGIPVDEKNKVKVYFKLVTKPDNLTGINISSAMTSSTGQATVQLTSGNKSGIAQVLAFALLDSTGTDTIRSPLVSIPIYGGFPDSNHITIKASRINLPAKNTSVTSTISAVIGDKYGNPVRPGTIVYFETDGGIVSPGSATTNEKGELSVTLTPSNPIPVSGSANVVATIASGFEGTSTPGGTSFPIVKKYATAKNSKPKGVTKVTSILQESVSILFSGAPVINSNNNNFVLSSGGTQKINYTVSDAAGNPLSGGSTISVAGIGMDSIGIVVNGDIAVTIPDTKDQSWTSFSIGVADLGSGNWTEGTQVGLSVNIQSPNGNVKKTIVGYLGQAPVDTADIPPSAREPAQIAFISSSANNIFVSGVGATEIATLTYEVRDSLGVALDQNRRVGVTFTSEFFPNSFTGGGTAPSILPSVDSSNAQGKVNVTIVSGTQAGVVQITAKLVTASKTIISQPVRLSVYSGFADQNHFTIFAPNYNYPGLQKAGAAPALNVGVSIGDIYSNPVAIGTQVYFHSTHGLMTAGAPTDARGFTSGTLTPGNPYPHTGKTLAGMGPGYGRVYAQTLGKNGTWIEDSILVLWTGAPIITNTGPSTFTVANGGVGGPFTFSVVDMYGHPMSAGTTISVSATTGEVTGANSTIMYDTFSTGEGITTFTVYLGDTDPSDVDPAVAGDIRVTVNHPVYGTYTLILASGTVD